MPLTPVQIDKARAVACELTLRSPNLDVLKHEHRDYYSPLANALQQNVSMTGARRRLLLPNLHAHGNGTVAIFSDYGGEGSGGFHTYSFLVCAWNEVGWFQQEMRNVRADCGLGHKEIEFKDFGMGRLRKALLRHDGIALKKMSVIVQPGEDGVLHPRVIEFTPTKLPLDVTFIGIDP